MNLNFEVSLEDIGIGLELSGNSESERQEVMDFLVHVDESVADYEFSQELIYRLAENFSHDTEGYRHLTTRIQAEGGDDYDLSKSVSGLAEDLSHLSEEHLIVLMADAIFRKRERTGCFDHTECDEWKQDKPLPLSTVCVCGHTKNWHMHGRGSSCQVAPDTSSATEYCPCPEFREKQTWKLTGRIDEVHSEEKQ